MNIYYGLTSKQQLRDCIRASCEALNPNNVPQSIDMLSRVAAQESHFGTFRDNYEKEGRGLTQIDSKRFKEIHAYATIERKELNDICIKNFGIDLRYVGFGVAIDYSPLLACVLTRIAFLKLKEPMPAVGDEHEQWYLYKRRWNSSLGAATRAEFIRNKIHIGD